MQDCTQWRGHHVVHYPARHGCLRAVMPSYAIISVGADNPYGHPAEETLARLGDVGAVVMHTDEMGTIECESDGKCLFFHTKK